MKKITLCIIAVLMISLLAVPVLAAQSATLSVGVSASSVHRGETVTVSVSTTAVENCTSGGFRFTFDTSVFEYVGGGAVGLGGYAMNGVSTAAGNVAGYFGSGKQTVQGTIFQITLKVKEDAALGSYTISGAPNMTAEDGAVSCGSGAATVSVVCNHSYGNWVKADDNEHSRTCANCQEVQKEAHTWNEGTTIREATCLQGGQVE